MEAMTREEEDFRNGVTMRVLDKQNVRAALMEIIREPGFEQTIKTSLEKKFVLKQ